MLFRSEDGGDDAAWDHSIWIDPRIELADGSRVSLTTMTWTHASAGYGAVSTEVGPAGRPMALHGKPVEPAIGAHAPSVIAFELPPNAVRFHATGALDDACLAQSQGATVRFAVYALGPDKEADRPGLPIEFTSQELGLGASMLVRDLWQHEDLGVKRASFAPVVPWHGARLYRVSPADRP